MAARGPYPTPAAYNFLRVPSGVTTPPTPLPGLETVVFCGFTPQEQDDSANGDEVCLLVEHDAKRVKGEGSAEVLLGQGPPRERKRSHFFALGAGGGEEPEALVPPARRVAYGEGEGRSRSGPASIL